MNPHTFFPDRPSLSPSPHGWPLWGLLAALLCISARATPPVYDHVVIVVEENENYSSVIGNSVEAPYINGLANSGALFTNMRSVTHPSHPNYLEFYSGNNQGVTGDSNPSGTP